MDTSQSTRIYVDNKVVGVVSGNTFIKNVHGNKHFLRTPPAIAFDVEALDNAIEAGATIVMVHDLDTQKDYYATIRMINSNGFKLDRGFGKQIALPIEYWEREPSNQMSLF